MRGSTTSRVDMSVFEQKKGTNTWASTGVTVRACGPHGGRPASDPCMLTLFSTGGARVGVWWQLGTDNLSYFVSKGKVRRGAAARQRTR